MTIRAPLPNGSTPIVTWGDIARDAALWLTDCPDAIIRDMVRRVAIERYTENRAWRAHAVAFGLTVAGQAAYAVALVDAQRIVGLPSITVGEDEALEVLTGGASGHDSHHILASISDADEITLDPAPTQAGLAVVADLALAPSLASTGLPDWLAAEHREALAAEAASRLAAMPRRAWSDPQTAAYQGQQAEQRWQLAAHRAGRRTRSPLRVMPAEAGDQLRRINQ